MKDELADLASWTENNSPRAPPAAPGGEVSLDDGTNSGLKHHGESGQAEKKLLPDMRKSLAAQLNPFAPLNWYNCDKSEIIFMKQLEYTIVRKGKDT